MQFPCWKDFWNTCVIWKILLILLIARLEKSQANTSCAFHTSDGIAAESEGVRFIRLREDAEVGKEILILNAYPRTKIALMGAEGSGDHKYFGLQEINATTIGIMLSHSLEDLVDSEVPKNLLKFRILCAGIGEKLEEGSYLSITVYIEDVNDNVPQFLNTPYTININENTPAGTVIFEGIQAIDHDKPNTPNSDVHFSISTVADQLSADGSPYFALKGPHRPLLVLKKELDFDYGIRSFKLPLFAWDRGTPVNQANTTITINVLDIDDLPPKFTEGVYRTKINEFFPLTGKPIRMPLYFSPPIMAYDQDSLNATLIYDIISGNERKIFRVSPHNGVVWIQKEIDLEEESLPGNTFVLQIEARQRDNPLQKAVARIEVEILDLNDNMPEFEADFYNISIVENLPTSFSVLQVNAIDRDQGENAEFLYNLIEEEVSKGAFRIDSRNGWITVRDDRLLDREQRKAIHLVVEAIERNPPYIGDRNFRRSIPNSVKVMITLLDTNDNTPKFERGNLYEFKVPITAPVGYKIGEVIALDPDDGPNGMLVYELQRPKGSGYIPFHLDSKNGSIHVSGPLRRGRIAVFVEASDQPTNPSERRFTLAVITIEVYATIDDQAIDFVGAPYEFWVGSDVGLGTSVGQVRTTLIYDGEDEIMYDLLHTYSEGVPFAIEERSGIITVIRELSEFKRKVYHFEAVANYMFANSSQPLPMPRSAQPKALELTDEGVLITNVTIHVVTKPDNRVNLRPVIEEINMNAITFHIEENLVGGKIGQLLYKNGVNVVNNDLGSYRELKHKNNVTIGSKFRSNNPRLFNRKRLPRRLVGDSNVKLRYIIANQQEVVNKISITEDGTLITLMGLDREQQPKYDLTVIVEYSTGLVSGAGIYQVHVKVDDVNDNAPKFNALTYVGLINENSASGSEVSTNQVILANDADEGRNAEFRVVLQGEYSEQFSIEYINDTSEVLNKSHYNSRLTNAETFNIFNLTDQWNEELKFVEMQTMLMEPRMKTDVGPHFRIKYTGKRQLDREKDQLYNLKIVAVDTGGLSTQANLNILIADVNDNAPIFERISVFKDSKIEIREYTTDMEIYFVESSFPQLQSVPSSIVIPPYQIPGSPRYNKDSTTFNATYMGATGQKPRARTRIAKKSRSPRAPYQKAGIVKCPLFAVYENIPLNTKVLQVIASDEDFGKNAQVHYEVLAEHMDRSISSVMSPKVYGAKYFTIDKLTGELQVNYPLMANAEIFLNLTATDIDGLKDTTCIRFTVIDVNNHAPTFKKSWYSFDVQEGEYNNSVLGQVLAVDLDYGENANVSYSLSELDLPFKIKTLSGIIKIIGTLDREVRAKYNFQVIAMDNAEPLYRMSSTVEVEVNVLDLNDNKPEFVGYDDMTNAAQYITDLSDKTIMVPIYKAYLDRSTTPGMFVKQVTAIDKDYVGNGNGLVLYSIQHQDLHTPIFQIDSRDGTISTIANFKSYNEYEHLNVTVVASDLGSPPHSSTAVVLINLQGQAVTEPNAKPIEVVEPQNISVFQHQYYEVKMLENNDAPVEILIVNLTKDIDVDAYHWTLLMEVGADAEDVHPPFEFEAKTGALYALKSFDRETKELYQLRIRAEKSNREARTYAQISYPVLDERIQGLEQNECRVVVNILDDNDNTPKFKGNGQPIIAVVPRSASFGYPVTTVHASDADVGLNAEIRYRLLNEPSRLFAIDEFTGKIRLIGNVPMDVRVYGFDVKAADRNGADDGRSSIINVFVYVIEEAKQVRIVVAGKPIEVERKIDSLTNLLSSAIQMDVRVRLLEPHVGGLEPATDAYIYAVDFRTNSILDMEQLHESLASLQLDTLQFQYEKQLQESDNMITVGASMPRIIELAEFGKLAHNNQSSSHLIGGLEILTFLLIILCGLGAATAALCFMCLRLKRRTWSQQDFQSSETGLTYTIARAGIESCRQQRKRHILQQHQLQQQQQQQCGKSIHTTSSFIPESVCSSAQTQSTAPASQKLEHQLHAHQHPHQQHSHHHHHHHHQQQQQQQQQQQHQQQIDQRQREYIDVPLPKSIVKNNLARCSSLEQDTSPAPFVLNYNSCQPVNNLVANSPYESSMFSLHSNGQDSGVDFLSSRELYETSPDSLQYVSANNGQRLNGNGLLCPKHAKAHMEGKMNNADVQNVIAMTGNVTIPEECTENYEENDVPLTASNCRSSMLNLCDHHRLKEQDYQSTNFERRNACVRHSFSGVRDDLVQNSPQVSLRPRGHTLRNSMNDLEERLQNLEQSFRRPIEFGKSHSIY